TSYVCYFFSFFFFQAEDGIRDLIVTGVQTCALPIFRREHPEEPAPAHERSRAAAGDRSCAGAGSSGCSRRSSWTARAAWPTTCRSEERRVGKECRSRWAREQGERRA